MQTAKVEADSWRNDSQKGKSKRNGKDNSQ